MIPPTIQQAANVAQRMAFLNNFMFAHIEKGSAVRFECEERIEEHLAVKAPDGVVDDLEERIWTIKFCYVKPKDGEEPKVVGNPPKEPQSDNGNKILAKMLLEAVEKLGVSEEQKVGV